MAMSYETFTERWMRFTNRLSQALQRTGKGVRAKGERLEIDNPVYRLRSSQFVVDAGVSLHRGGLRLGNVAALHFNDLPQQPDERRLADLARQLHEAAAAWQSGPRQGWRLPVINYDQGSADGAG